MTQPFFGALAQSSFVPSGGGGGSAPAWLLSGATSGISFTAGEFYFNDTLGTNFTQILGAHAFGSDGSFDFDPASISASGMDMTLASNRPVAKGALFTLLTSNDYACRYEINLNNYDETSAALGTIYLFDAGIGDYGAYTDGQEIFALFYNYDLSPNTDRFICTDWNGNYDAAVGGTTKPGVNKYSFQLDGNGTIYSGNGGTAASDPTALGAFGGAGDLITVGWEWVTSDIGTPVTEYPIQGHVRSIMFYPSGKNAAAIEALSA